MPPSNQQRRDQITDAAIEVVARDGLHGLSHREVDKHAGLPRGTTSNYFRSREALVAATIQRIVDLHFALIDELRTRYAQSDACVIDLLADVVDEALTRFGGRYVAMFELALESTRKPELRAEFDRIADEAMKLTYDAHRDNGTEPSQRDIELLNVFYNGVLFTSLVMPQTLGGRSPGEITRIMLETVLEPTRREAGPPDRPAGDRR
ncbi:MAG TPA: TetR family transcriptional regulator [Mycobacterium sp.]|nr:TetR family transcriptional regulator [Mycobacterium sp.]